MGALSLHPTPQSWEILSLFAGCYSIACVVQDVRHESDMLGHEARDPRAPKNDSTHESEPSHAPCLTGRRPVAITSTGVVSLVKTGKTHRYSRALNACTFGQMTLALQKLQLQSPRYHGSDASIGV